MTKMRHGLKTDPCNTPITTAHYPLNTSTKDTTQVKPLLVQYRSI